VSGDPLAPVEVCPFGCYAYSGLAVSKAHAESLHDRLRAVKADFDAYRLTHP